ncbi:hypothetical protein D9M72_505780 [compost metagenome]
MASVPVVRVSAGSVIVLPVATVTAVPLVAAEGAVAVNAAVLFVPPDDTPMLATLPVRLFAPHALASCSVEVFGVFL